MERTVTGMTVVAIVGAQYGSEGKGAIAAKIANDFEVHVRTGAPNAGHTYYIDAAPGEVGDDRQKVVARSVPCGAANPNAHLVIGPGGMLDLDLLELEVAELDRLGLDVRNRLYIDKRAMVIDPQKHHQFEGGTEGVAHQLIGSTGEGVGPARMAQIARGTIPAPTPTWLTIEHAGDQGPREYLTDGLGVTVHDDTSQMLNSWIDLGQNILLEGTQGSGLSMVHGEWPYCTSTDTNGAQMLVDSGISPKRFTQTILVARTFPIRVAGNSGPLKGETTFEALGVQPEQTTVTKKIRRIGAWDSDLFGKSVRLNGPFPSVALTFLDYVFPSIAGKKDWYELGPEALRFVEQIEDRHSCMIDFVGTGPDSVAVNPRCSWTK